MRLKIRKIVKKWNINKEDYRIRLRLRMKNMKQKKTAGTREWADRNVNICSGCKNDCVYCYAAGMALRYKRLSARETWKHMIINTKALDRTYSKPKQFPFRIMFPSTHDIVPENLEACITVLKKMLQAGNRVLITTKPQIDCIMTLIEDLEEYKDLIKFRFTITTLDHKLSKFYEPYAPLPDERLEAAKNASLNYYRTSISIEPYLLNDDKAPLNQLVSLILATNKVVTSSIWVGSMNQEFCPPQLWREDFWGKEARREILLKLIRNPLLEGIKLKLKDSMKLGIYTW